MTQLGDEIDSSNLSTRNDTGLYNNYYLSQNF